MWAVPIYFTPLARMMPRKPVSLYSYFTVSNRTRLAVDGTKTFQSRAAAENFSARGVPDAEAAGRLSSRGEPHVEREEEELNEANERLKVRCDRDEMFIHIFCQVERSAHFFAKWWFIE